MLGSREIVTFGTWTNIVTLTFLILVGGMGGPGEIKMASASAPSSANEPAMTSFSPPH